MSWSGHRSRFAMNNPSSKNKKNDNQVDAIQTRLHSSRQKSPITEKKKLFSLDTTLFLGILWHTQLRNKAQATQCSRINRNFCAAHYPLVQIFPFHNTLNISNTAVSISISFSICLTSHWIFHYHNSNIVVLYNKMNGWFPKESYESFSHRY